MIKWNEEYQVYVSDDGRVYNKDMREYTLETTYQGYKRFITHRSGKRIRVQVHRLVYETFIGKLDDKLVIDHINRIKSDNNVSNLRQVSQQVNNLNKGYYTRTEFGEKFKNYFGIYPGEDKKLYRKEYSYFYYHGKCSWE